MKSDFDWDDGNRAKCTKHGVSVAKIETLFASGTRGAPDIAHSVSEDRLIAVGRTSEGRPLFVAFTLRRRGDRSLIRPISACYMHKKEADAYEKSSKAQDR